MSQIARFEALLRRAAVMGAEVRVVPSINSYYGDVEFYAHINGHDSDTVDASISNGPVLHFVELDRAASGIRGLEAQAISDEAASFTRQPLPASQEPRKKADE
jgi:hypothetical protein